MKNNLLKFYMLAFFLVSDFIMFAQDCADPTDPGCEGGEGPPLEEPDDLPSGSINAKLIYLAIIGVMFAFYYYNKKKQEQLEN